MEIDELRAEIEEIQKSIEQLNEEKKRTKEDAWRAKTFTERDKCFAHIAMLDMKIEDAEWRIKYLNEQIQKIEDGTINEPKEQIEYDPENPTIEGLLNLFGE